MLYNPKWFENFQACGELAFKNESKEATPFFMFFHKNLTFKVLLPIFLQGQKKDFCHFKR